jgi:hypothetical protein
MEFQLVVQFKGGGEAVDLNFLVSLEYKLIDRLGDSAVVDGHDSGSGEGNIFVITKSPIDTFRQVRAVLADQDLLDTARVAYRDFESDQYTWLWPLHSVEPFEVA